MIKDLGFRHVSIRSLRLPGDLRELVQNSSVTPLAEGMRDIGQAHPVVIRKSDHRIVCGKRRLAAAIRANLKRVWVRWVEGDDLDCLLMSRSENLHRRDVPPSEQNEMATELVELMSRRIRETDPIPQKPNGRPTSPRVIARGIVAEVRGVTPATLRVYENKERRERGEPPLKRGRPRNDELAVGPNVELLGVEPDESWLVQVVEVAAQLEAALRMTRQAKRHLAAISAPLPKISAQALAKTAAVLEAQLKALKPGSVCPYCKCLDHLVENCEACSGAGWLGEGQMKGVPRELLDGENPRVVVDGQIVDAHESQPQPQAWDLFG